MASYQNFQEHPYINEDNFSCYANSGKTNVMFVFVIVAKSTGCL